MLLFCCLLHLCIKFLRKDASCFLLNRFRHCISSFFCDQEWLEMDALTARVVYCPEIDSDGRQSMSNSRLVSTISPGFYMAFSLNYAPRKFSRNYWLALFSMVPFGLLVIAVRSGLGTCNLGLLLS